MIKIDAQKYMERLEKLDIMISNKLAEQAQWRDRANKITANLDGDRVQSSSVQSTMADAINECVAMEQEIAERVTAMRSEYREIVATIEMVENPTEYDVLHKRYVLYWEFDEIAAKYGKDYSWATTTHGRAKVKVQEILDARMFVTSCD